MNEAIRPKNIAPESWAKFDRDLKEEVRRRSGDPKVELPVSISMARPSEATKERDVKAQESRFAEASRGLVGQLERLGARKIERLWINWTVAAMASIGALNEIGKREDVTRISLVVRHKAVC